MNRFFIVSFLIPFCINTQGFSQSLRVSHIHYRKIDDKIEIFYDLPLNHDSLNVKIVFRKKSNPQFLHHPQFINGAIGKGIFSGKNKKITWYFKKEPTYLFTGSGFYFKINAMKIPDRINKN